MNPDCHTSHSHQGKSVVDVATSGNGKGLVVPLQPVHVHGPVHALCCIGERIVTVGGVGCPCGGTHVKNVADIRAVRVTKIKKVYLFGASCHKLSISNLLVTEHVGEVEKWPS